MPGVTPAGAGTGLWAAAWLAEEALTAAATPGMEDSSTLGRVGRPST